jgi:HK97 family phage major capsid protein
MSTVLKLKAKAAQKRGEAQKILDAIANGPEARSLTPEEQTKFDGLMSDVATIKTQIVAAKAIEDEDEADELEEEKTPSPAERSLRRSRPIADEGPAIHTAERNYSFIRAIKAQVEHRPLDGLEGEISREIEKRKGQAPDGFYMPTGSNPELRALMYPGAAKREAMYGSGIRRDLTTTTGAGGVFLVPELPMIELLRAKMVLRELGATFLTDMHGTFAMPRQNAKATVNWLGEGNSATPSNPGVDQVPFVPKVAIALVNISKQFMNQTSVDAEVLVKDDLASSMAHELDRVGINGSGTTQPFGLLQIAAIQTLSSSLALGANGGAPTYNAMVAMESIVASNNADRGSLAYLTNPHIRGELKDTPKIGTTFPTFVWENSQKDGSGEINGYRALATTNVPNNLTKGSSSTCSGIIFGNWKDLVVAQWEGVDTVVNPYTNQAAGAILISMAMSVDVECRHNESFAIITDAT